MRRDVEHGEAVCLEKRAGPPTPTQGQGIIFRSHCRLQAAFRCSFSRNPVEPRGGCNFSGAMASSQEFQVQPPGTRFAKPTPQTRKGQHTRQKRTHTPISLKKPAKSQQAKNKIIPLKNRNGASNWPKAVSTKPHAARHPRAPATAMWPGASTSRPFSAAWWTPSGRGARKRQFGDVGWVPRQIWSPCFCLFAGLCCVNK